MSNYQIKRPTISLSIKYFLKEKALPFIKQGLFIPFLFATLLYILMRVFFIGAEFDLTESVELYAKTFMVTWIYINAFRLICYGIIWLESRSRKVTMAKLMAIPVLKKTAILIITAGLTYSVKARTMNISRQENKQDLTENKNNTKGNYVDPRFYLWMK